MNKKFSLLILISLLVSFYFFAISEGHYISCHEYKCQTCTIIENIQTNKVLVVSLFLINVSLFETFIKVSNNYNFYANNKTLVSQKIRIDD